MERGGVPRTWSRGPVTAHSEQGNLVPPTWSRERGDTADLEQGCVPVPWILSRGGGTADLEQGGGTADLEQWGGWYRRLGARAGTADLEQKEQVVPRSWSKGGGGTPDLEQRGYHGLRARGCTAELEQGLCYRGLGAEGASTHMCFHFSRCACHPCARAIVILSVSSTFHG